MQIVNDECLQAIRKLPDNYFDSVVTDPPYGISFMGKRWDYHIPKVEVWREVYRVLKPGGHILVACGTKTQHRMAVNIEDAGFEIRDIISWIYGSGFPKSMDVSKAIDKTLGVEREKVKIEDPSYLRNQKSIAGGEDVDGGDRPWLVEAREKGYHLTDSKVPVSPEAERWEGYGTGLKPAMELFTLARKPISEKTIAANVLRWGTGALNIDACRIEIDSELDDKRLGGKGDWSSEKMAKNVYEGGYAGKRVTSSSKGRFPANVIHDGHQLVLDLFPHTKTGAMKKPYAYTNTGTSMGAPSGHTKQIHEANEGSAARFFYCAKASRKERGKDNDHPTVKPVKLMEYLINLINPKGGRVLDCYAGSGSTGVAARNLGVECILIEREKEYCHIISRRLGRY